MDTLPHKLFRFGRRVVRAFQENRGLLLAGGVGYNTLLSVIPLFAVLLTFLSMFFDEQKLLRTLELELQVILPRYSKTLVDAVAAFLDNRELVSGIGFLVLLFFSSLAFRMLEDAITLIFHRPRQSPKKRSFWISAVIPYVYMLILGLSVLFISLLTAAFDALASVRLETFGYEVPVRDISRLGTYGVLFCGLALLFTSIYKVLPVVEIRLKRAAIGGLTAAVLWLATSRFLVWYFATISLVNVIYGSLATVIVVLLGMEVAAVIILLGAQVIAELEESARLGIPWWEDPR